MTPKQQSKTTSVETVRSAEAIAKGSQKPGQTKEQTRLIALGIQKGVEQYKKQQKAKARDADKAKKKQQKLNMQNAETVVDNTEQFKGSKLPWLLLGLSWLGFIAYLAMS